MCSGRWWWVLSWPFSVCLLPLVLPNAMSFHRSSGEPEFKTSHGFFGVPQNLTSRTYSLHSLLCTSLIFDYNSFSLQPVFLWWHTATSIQFSWSDTAVLTMQTCNDASLRWRLEWPKIKWNWNKDSEWDAACESNRTVFVFCFCLFVCLLMLF